MAEITELTTTERLAHEAGKRHTALREAIGKLEEGDLNYEETCRAIVDLVQNLELSEEEALKIPQDIGITLAEGFGRMTPG